MSSYELSPSFDDIEDQEKKEKAKRLVAYQSLISKATEENDDKAATRK